MGNIRIKIGSNFELRYKCPRQVHFTLFIHFFFFQVIYCKTLKSLFFQYKSLKKLHKNCSRFVSLPGKIINVNQSFSFQLYKITIDQLFEVSRSNVKTMFGCNIISLSFRIKLFKVNNLVERKISRNFFCHTKFLHLACAKSVQ